MATFFGRRYARPVEAISRAEKASGFVILALVAAVLAAFAVTVATDRDYLFAVDEQAYAAAEGQSAFPDVGLEGWRTPRRVDRFTADNLYVKIDGRAETYLRFHVVGLTFGRYVHQSDPDRAVDVYWYDMGNADNALGMYRFEEAPDAAPVSIGRDGYRVGGAVFFHKGANYVQVLPTSLDGDDARAALKIAERLAERIEDTVDGP